MTADEAARLLEEAQKRKRGFTLPDPLVPCDRCGRHAAFYSDSGGGGSHKFYCGPCGPHVSIFRLPIPADDPAVLAADAALLLTGARLDGCEPQTWEGDQA